MSEHGRGLGAILRSCKSRKTILSGTFECDYANGMRKLVAELEFQSLEIRTSEGAKMLKSKVHEAMTEAESNTAPCVIIDRFGPAYVCPNGVVKGERLHQHHVSPLRQEMHGAMKIIIRILEYPGPHKTTYLTCDLLSDHLLMSPGNTVMITPKTTTAII